jgi:RNA polymerase sigma-70 factor (ECF subfamily)
MIRGTFGDVFEAHRRELLAHCYRLTGSFVDAEDLVQETFLRAWRGLDGFEGRSSVRTWLYRIATNVCVDAAVRRSRRPVPTGDLLAEHAALQPYPDRLLPVRAEDSAGDVVTARETIELGFIAALLHLPLRQRVVAVVRDVLGWTAAETAELLDISIASTNSLLQRARATLQRHAPTNRLAWTRPELTEEDEEVLRRYVSAHERGDARAIIAMLRADVRITMPPAPPYVGVGAASAFFDEILGREAPGEWRLVPTRANGRLAAANYLRRPGDDRYRALSIDVLDVRDGEIVAANCFLDAALFPAFGLPPEHPEP